jgi:4-diphosphocytidyl-2-C-methyl-D-erythritol kinase
MPTRVRSFCKINLGLTVGPARPDGFHALRTVYQTLALHDLVTVTAHPARATSITLTANHSGVPCTATGDAERNTAYKIVAAALLRMGVTAHVAIGLDKRLPVQGGMGAGSANAVAALLGLERELGLSLPQPDRLALAAEVGSDVPLFLLGGTVFGTGRGEQVDELPDLPAMPCVVALPQMGVSTALAFRELDARMVAAGTTELTFQQAGHTLEKLSRVLAPVHTTHGAELGSSSSAPDPSGITRPGSPEQPGDLAENPGPPFNLLNGTVNPLLALVRTGIENDFEEVVFSQYPSLRSTKRDLVGNSGDGALYAALSGSGSALFGLYASQAAADAAQHRVQANGTRAILTETLPRRQYWHTMFAE